MIFLDTILFLLEVLMINLSICLKESTTNIPLFILQKITYI